MTPEMKLDDLRMTTRIFFVALFCLSGLISPQVISQSNPDRYRDDIFLFMDETDLPLDSIRAFADRYFQIHGKERGSGYKQFQRWWYERQFHVDGAGYLIDPQTEYDQYLSFQKKQTKSRRTATPWMELGPSTWTPTSGWNPGNGRITSVAALSSNLNTIYVSSPGGGIWKSVDGGNNWAALLDNVNSSWMKIYNIAIDPSNPSTLYAAVMGEGVIKSVNGGTTWFETGDGPGNTRKVIVHPSNSSIVLATAMNGIFRSTNGGSTWVQTNSFNAEDIEFKPGDPNIVYVSGNSNQLRRSVNNGASWSTIGNAQGITNTGRTLLGVSPADPAVVYAVQSNGSNFGRLYKSSDSGQNFSTTIIGDPAMGTNFFGYPADGTGTSGQAGYDMAICVNPGNANEVHIAGIICWKSTNGGFNFTAETEWFYPNGTGYNHADVHALEWIGNVLFSGSDGGVYKSTNNGGDWTDLSQGIGIRQIYRMTNSKSDPNVITIGAQDNGSSYRQSTGIWREWLGADGMDNLISPTDANMAFGTSQNGQLYKTLNGGSSYSGINEPADGNWITPLAMHPTDHSKIYAGWNDVYKSTNAGATWTNISNQFINRNLDVLAVSPSNTDYIYASATNVLFRTQNGGVSWDSVSLSSNITSVYISQSNPLKIWITLNVSTNQVRYSENGGNTFQVISAGLPSLSARSVVVDETNYNGVYVALNLGVYYKNDVSDWEEFGTGLPLVANNEVELQMLDSKIRVATYGRGVWENDLEPALCTSTVITTADSGLGSLRAAIQCTTAGDTITFAPGLVGQFIDLTTGPLQIIRNIVMLPPSGSVIKIRTQTGGPVFLIKPGQSLVLKNMELYGGSNPSARVIQNFGVLLLEDVTLYDNVSGSGSMIENKGSFTTKGLVQIHQ